MTNDHKAGAEARLPSWALITIHVLFFLSGAAALTYEVVWMRMLSFVFGNTTYAVSVVLAVFLGGLAIGALAYGRVADRRGDLLRVYGVLEAGAAAVALTLPFVLLRVLTPVYTWIYRYAGESIAALTAARLVLSGVLLLIPAILLGGTLPVLVRFVVRSDEGMEAHVGRLYGLNTLGAVAGSFSTGFLLLPYLGVRLANASGAAVGLTVAAAALLVHRALGAQATAPVTWRPQSRPPDGAALERKVLKWLLMAFALSGFAALAYEVLWTRLLVFFFQSFVYAFSAMLSVYLLGLALGSLIYAAWLSRSPRPLMWFVSLEILIGLCGAATMPLFLILPPETADSLKATFARQTLWTFAATAVIMLAPTTLIGAVFPLVSAAWARATGRVGTSLGQAYLLNTLGTVAGSLGTGFLLIPAIGTRLGIFVVAGLNVGAGLLVWAVQGKSRPQIARRAFAALAAPVLLVAVMNARYTPEDLVGVYGHGLPVTIEWAEEGIDGTVTVERATTEEDALFGLGTDRRLCINGVPVAGTRVDLHTTQKLQAHLGLLIRPGARRVLQVGFGSGGTAYSASLHPVDRIDCVEISAAVIGAAPLFEETNHGVLADPRVRLYLEDARSFVRHAEHAYDVILSDSTHPFLAGEGLLYSVDYLRDCAERLRPGGVFSTWLPVYAMLPRDAKVMVRSIQAVFPYVYVWHTSIGRNEWCIVHGMRQPLAIDYDDFAREMSLPGVAQDLAQIGLHRPEEVLALLLYDDKAVARWVSDSDQLNTDDNGYLEFMGPRGTLRYPAPRAMHRLFTFPDIVLNAGGSILDYVSSRDGGERPWAERLHREAEANRHVLYARIYELALQDRHDLLAVWEYRRALQLVPDHYVAETMLGLSPGQLEALREAAGSPETRLVARDQLAAALAELGRLDEAALIADEIAAGVPSERGPAVVIDILRRRWDDVARRIDQTSSRDGARYLGMTRRGLEELLSAQEAAAHAPHDAERWQTFGLRYARLGDAIRSNTQAYGSTSANLRLRGFRIRGIAVMLTEAAVCYERAVALEPDGLAARIELAHLRAALGERQAALAVLEFVVRGPRSNAEAEKLLRELRDAEEHPFAFLEGVRYSVLAQVADLRG